MNPCPHCGARARAEASPFFRWRCAVCGAPVLADEAGRVESPLPSVPLAALVRAQRLRAMAVGWFAVAVAFAIIAALAGGLTLLLWATTHTVMLASSLLGAVAIVAISLALVGRTRGGHRNAEARRELQVAFEAFPTDPATIDETSAARGTASE